MRPAQPQIVLNTVPLTLAGCVATLAMLSLAPAQAQERKDLPQPRGVEFSSCRVAPVSAAPEEATGIDLEADRVDRQEEQWHLQGNARVRYGDTLLGAEEVFLDGETSQIKVQGGLRASSPGLRLEAEEAEIDPAGGRFEARDLRYRLEQSADASAGGVASRLERHPDGMIRVEDATYTTCAPAEAAWALEADSIEIDFETGQGRARGAVLRVGDVPVLSLPWLPFPVGNKRLSGWLAPRFEESDDLGVSAATPYYFNLAPHYDLTVTPRLMSKRGLQLGARVRYRTHTGAGELEGEYLDDSDDDEQRYLVHFRHEAAKDAWDWSVHYTDLSDLEYLDDFTSGDLTRTIPYIPHHARLAWRGDFFGAAIEATGTERIDPGDELWDRLPRARAHAELPFEPAGLKLRADFASDFFRANDDEPVSGERYVAGVSVSRPVTGAGWYVTPGARLRHIAYQLEGLAADADRSPSRTVPEATLDAGLRFEKTLASGMLQTLEPKLFYLNRKYRAHDHLPRFDTAPYEPNFRSLFRADSHSGFDRTPPANQLTLGITSRITDPASGLEVLSASLGRIWYFRDPDPEDQRDPAHSALAAEVEYRPQRHTLWHAGLRYDGEGTTDFPWRSVLVRYQPGDALLQAQYLYDWQDATEEVEQGSLSAIWSLGEGLRIAGQYHYDFARNRGARQLLALEYMSCCLGLSVGMEQERGQDSRILLQVLLIGLGGDRDTPAQELLRDVRGEIPWWQ